MTPSSINIAIAKLLPPIPDCGCGNPQCTANARDFHGDLNDCAEMEATLEPSIEHELENSGHIWNEYVNTLDDVCARTGDTCVAATAPQRCEAFLRVKGKWLCQ
jgi:hypothetical protein